MSVSPEDLARVREAGKQLRPRLSRKERKRHELAAVVDTGNLSDEDVDTLWSAYTGARDQPVEEAR